MINVRSQQMRWIKLLCVGFIVVSNIIFIYKNRSVYTKSYDYAYYSDQYLNSQYVKGEGSKYIVSDSDLYSYAGYYYVTGGEVTRVNFENPPLGKYLIGVSILLFHNQMVINLIYFVFYLLITYLFGRLLFGEDSLAPFIAPCILSLDPYIHYQITHAHLDFPMALFFLWGFYFFLQAKRPWHYLLSSLFFGLSLSTKFFPFFTVIFGLLIWYQWRYRKQTLSVFLTIFLIVPIIYSLTYAEFFLHQTLIEFIKFQWWMVRWRMGNPIVVGNALFAIFTGKLRIWWEAGKPAAFYPLVEWSWLLPTMVSVTGLSAWLFRKRRLHLFIYAYLFVFLLYIIFVTEGGLKYLLPLYPFFAIFSSAMCVWMIRRKHIV